MRVGGEEGAGVGWVGFGGGGGLEIGVGTANGVYWVRWDTQASRKISRGSHSRARN